MSFSSKTMPKAAEFVLAMRERFGDVRVVYVAEAGLERGELTRQHTEFIARTNKQQ